jgi:hypothetical protein
MASRYARSRARQCSKGGNDLGRSRVFTVTRVEWQAATGVEMMQQWRRILATRWSVRRLRHFLFHRRNGPGDLLGPEQGRHHRPAIDACIANTKHAGVSIEKSVDRRVNIDETQCLSNDVHVPPVSCQQRPAGCEAVLPGVGLQIARLVDLWRLGDGEEENILPHPVAENFLHLNQIGCVRRADVLACGVDHVEYDDFIAFY